jgi:hypothetical protein
MCDENQKDVVAESEEGSSPRIEIGGHGSREGRGLMLNEARIFVAKNSPLLSKYELFFE